MVFFIGFLVIFEIYQIFFIRYFVNIFYFTLGTTFSSFQLFYIIGLYLFVIINCFFIYHSVFYPRRISFYLIYHLHFHLYFHISDSSTVVSLLVFLLSGIFSEFCYHYHISNLFYRGFINNLYFTLGAYFPNYNYFISSVNIYFSLFSILSSPSCSVLSS